MARRGKKADDGNNTAVIDAPADTPTSEDAPATRRPRRRKAAETASAANGAAEVVVPDRPPGDVADETAPEALVADAPANTPAAEDAPAPRKQRRRRVAEPPAATNGAGAAEVAVPDFPPPGDQADEAAPVADTPTPELLPLGDQADETAPSLPASQDQVDADAPPVASDEVAAARTIAQAIQQLDGKVQRQGRVAVLKDLAAITDDDYGVGRAEPDNVRLRGLTLEGFIGELSQPQGGRVGQIPRVGATAIQELLQALRPGGVPASSDTSEAPRRRRRPRTPAAAEQPAQTTTPAPEPEATPAPEPAGPQVENGSISISNETRLAQLERIWQTLSPAGQRAVIHYAAMLAIES